MPCELILLRHGHRPSGPDHINDTGLSERGQSQAEAIATYYATNYDCNQPVHIATSPARRCQETVAPLARILKQPALVDNDLNEGQAGEDGAMFIMRMERFLDTCRHGPHSRIIACSHVDWIPHFVHLFAGADVFPGTGCWIRLGVDDTGVSLLEVQQELSV